MCTSRKVICKRRCRVGGAAAAGSWEQPPPSCSRACGTARAPWEHGAPCIVLGRPKLLESAPQLPHSQCVCPVIDNEAVRDLENKSYREQQKELGLFSL